MFVSLVFVRECSFFMINWRLRAFITTAWVLGLKLNLLSTAAPRYSKDLTSATDTPFIARLSQLELSLALLIISSLVLPTFKTSWSGRN